MNKFAFNRLTPFVLGLLAGIFISLIAAAAFIAASRIWKPTETKTANPTRSPIETVPEPMVTITQDGNSVFAFQLLELHRRNPNRFKVRNERSNFVVKGRISDVSEFNETINDTSGFYVPLAMEKLIFPGDAREISLFVVGFDERAVAKFNPGDAIAASCPAIRVVANGLVFDRCKLIRRATAK